MVDLINLNKTNYSGDGVDRSRWQFDEDGFGKDRWTVDEDGFMKAKDGALETARRHVILEAEKLNKQMMEEGQPSTAVRSIDGVDNASDDSFKL